MLGLLRAPAEERSPIPPPSPGQTGMEMRLRVVDGGDNRPETNRDRAAGSTGRPDTVREDQTIAIRPVLGDTDPSGLSDSVQAPPRPPVKEQAEGGRSPFGSTLSPRTANIPRQSPGFYRAARSGPGRGSRPPIEPKEEPAVASDRERTSPAAGPNDVPQEPSAASEVGVPPSSLAQGPAPDGDRPKAVTKPVLRFSIDQPLPAQVPEEPGPQRADVGREPLRLQLEGPPTGDNDAPIVLKSGAKPGIDRSMAPFEPTAPLEPTDPTLAERLARSREPVLVDEPEEESRVGSDRSEPAGEAIVQGAGDGVDPSTDRVGPTGENEPPEPVNEPVLASDVPETPSAQPSDGSAAAGSFAPALASFERSAGAGPPVEFRWEPAPAERSPSRESIKLSVGPSDDGSRPLPATHSAPAKVSEEASVDLKLAPSSAGQAGDAKAPARSAPAGPSAPGILKTPQAPIRLSMKFPSPKPAAPVSWAGKPGKEPVVVAKLGPSATGAGKPSAGSDGSSGKSPSEVRTAELKPIRLSIKEPAPKAKAGPNPAAGKKEAPAAGLRGFSASGDLASKSFANSGSASPASDSATATGEQVALARWEQWSLLQPRKGPPPATPISAGTGENAPAGRSLR